MSVKSEEGDVVGAQPLGISPWVDDPDEWVTQDRVPARPGIDERRYEGGDSWDDAANIAWRRDRPAVHGAIALTGVKLELRCRRKDLPPLPVTAATKDSVPVIRQFETGATRNLDNNKLDYEGFFSPLAMKSFAEYMHSHRQQKDGTLRDADNWQKGIPIEVYMKSMWRHFMDVWTIHRGGTAISPDTGNPVELEEALNAVMFNVQGYMHELLKGRK